MQTLQGRRYIEVKNLHQGEEEIAISKEEQDHLSHVPTQLKYWEDKMYDAEFEGRWRQYHEAKAIYLRFKKLSEEGVEYEPNF